MEKMNLLTIDFEDWFHVIESKTNTDVNEWHKYESHLENILSQLLMLFDKYDVKATFFTVGWIAEKYPHLMQEICSHGHDIGMHTYSHRPLTEMTEKEFIADLCRCREAIFKACGYNPLSFRAPAFSITDKNVHFLRNISELGSLYDSSIAGAWHSHTVFNQFRHHYPVRLVFSDGSSLLEFPITTFGVGRYQLIYGGGGYFRHYPFALTQMLFRQHNYNMVYLHPREFDSSSPRVEASRRGAFKLYRNVDKTYFRLEYLLNHYSFVNIIQAAEICNRQLLPSYIL